MIKEGTIILDKARWKSSGYTKYIVSFVKGKFLEDNNVMMLREIDGDFYMGSPFRYDLEDLQKLIIKGDASIEK